MQVGVLTVPLASEPLSEPLSYLDGIGVDAVELGCGGHPGDEHLSREEYIYDEAPQAELHSLFDDHGMNVSALATHNNPLHPDERL